MTWPCELWGLSGSDRGMSQHVEWKQTGTHLTRHTAPLLGRLHPRPCPTLDPVSSPEPVPLRTRPHSEPGPTQNPAPSQTRPNLRLGPTTDPAPLQTWPHSRPGPTPDPAPLRARPNSGPPHSGPGHTPDLAPPSPAWNSAMRGRDLVSASPDPSPFLC
ncbi:unnamed protein product [Arctogadus glacialis]